MSTNLEKTKTRIVILGAGFAGIYVAINLSKKLDTNDSDILIVDSNNYHLFKPMIHEVATGGVEPYHIIQPVRRIMKGLNFRFLEGNVNKIDTEKKVVQVCEECAECTKMEECNPKYYGLELKDIVRTKRKAIPYDYLVIAVGGSPNYFNVPGAKKFSFPINTLEDATRIRKHLIDLFKIASNVEDKELRKKLLTFVVIGAGPTGMELVSDLHDWIYEMLVSEFPEIIPEEISIYLVEAGPDILPLSDAEIKTRTKKQLSSRKIEILTKSPVTEVTKEYVVLGGSRKIYTFTTLWAAGVKGNDIIAETTVKRDKLDRVVVNEFLEAEGLKGVYAIGDCSCFSPLGKPSPLPQTAQVAVQEAKCVVNNILADLKGKEKRPLKYRDLGAAFSIGEYTALANILGVLKIGGLLGWLLWKLTYLEHLVGIKLGLRAALEWFFDITYDREASRHKFAR